ncbi:MAG TPA: type II secretion system protein GspN [Nitrospiria bacterium]
MMLLEWAKRNRAALMTVLGYLSAGLITVTVFVYLTFPWKELSDWVRYQAEKSLAVKIEVRENRVGFPFQMIWKGVSVSVPQTASGAMEIEEIRVNWPLGAVLRRRFNLAVSARGLGGEAAGRLSVLRTSEGMKMHLTADGGGFEIGRLAALMGYPGGDLFGSIRITRLVHEWMGQDWTTGDGSLTLEASDVEHKKWNVRFQKIGATLHTKGGMGRLENVKAEGPSLDLVGNGTLLFRPNPADSLLNFTSRVTLHKPTGPLALLTAMASADGHLDFALRGPLRNPSTYVNGTLMSSGAAGL